MSTTSERLADLRAQQADLEALAAAEDAAAEAKAAYRKNQTDENKAAHRAASAALNDARAKYRSNRAPDPESEGDAVVPVGK